MSAVAKETSRVVAVADDTAVISRHQNLLFTAGVWTDAADNAQSQSLEGHNLRIFPSVEGKEEKFAFH